MDRAYRSPIPDSPNHIRLGRSFCLFILSLFALIASIIMWEIFEEECPKDNYKYYNCSEKSCIGKDGETYPCNCSGYCFQKIEIKESLIIVRISLLVIGIIGLHVGFILICYYCKQFKLEQNPTKNNLMDMHNRVFHTACA